MSTAIRKARGEMYGTRDGMEDEGLPDLENTDTRTHVLENAEACFDDAIYWLTYALGDSHAAVKHMVEWTPAYMKPRLSRSGVNPNTRREAFERDAFRCVQCQDWHSLCIDHIIPVAKGGGNGIENLQTLCEPCNSRKGDRVDSI